MLTNPSPTAHQRRFQSPPLRQISRTILGTVPLVGSEYGRKGERKATREVGGISSQQLRYIEILLLAPWRIRLGKTNGYPFASAKQVQVANPVSFLTQKILIQDARDRKDRAKDILYIHDTIEGLDGSATYALSP